MQQVIALIIAFCLLTILFGLLERWFPAIDKKMALRRPSSTTDICYWFFNPVVTRAVALFCLGLVVFAMVAVSGVDVEQIRTEGFGPVAQQPLWLIVIEMLLLGDLVGYWIHRLFHHVPDLWDLHAVHHCSTHLDWLSSVRVHPLNDILAKTLRVIPFVLLGFPLSALAAYLPFLILMALLLHANVPWSFGPLRHIIASPNFHRWHHTSAAEGRDCNFAGLFPFYDKLFGTYYLPAHPPQVFGVEEEIPTGFVQQLLYPFTVKRTKERAPAAKASLPV